MWRLFIFLVVLIVSVWFGVEVVRHPGYLLVVYQPWMIQMPIWFAALSLIVGLGLFYLIVNGIDRLQFWFFRVKNWFRIRREHKSYSKTQLGLTMLIEGRWKKAEKLLMAGVNQSLEPLMNYLGAAKAAQKQGAYDRRDNYIQKAYQLEPDADLAIGLTQAELEFEQDQLEHAAATLNHLRAESPYHPGVLKLLEKVYVRLADWKQLESLLPYMRKAKIINSNEMSLFEKNIYCEMLRETKNKNTEELQQRWHDMPRSVKKNPDVICEYVKQLVSPYRVRSKEINLEAEELIRKALKQSYQPELVKIYGGLPFTNLNRQLVIVGAWLKMYGQKPEILLTLGKLCMRVQLWGKARDYFDKCLSYGPSTEASLEYGKLLEQLNEPEAAMQKYRDGLASTLYE